MLLLISENTLCYCFLNVKTDIITHVPCVFNVPNYLRITLSCYNTGYI